MVLLNETNLEIFLKLKSIQEIMEMKYDNVTSNEILK